jgi:UDP-2,3-diacylglucosamine pyrophosphatase LpxH
MHTLVISDLHLGMRRRQDVLTQPRPLAVLLKAVADVDRLVMLGDVVELSEGRPEHALEVAEPVLRALGRRLGPGREVILVPGNHDRAFVAPWVQQMGDHSRSTVRSRSMPRRSSRRSALGLGRRG